MRVGRTSLLKLTFIGFSILGYTHLAEGMAVGIGRRGGI